MIVVTASPRSRILSQFVWNFLINTSEVICLISPIPLPPLLQPLPSPCCLCSGHRVYPTSSTPPLRSPSVLAALRELSFQALLVPPDPLTGEAETQRSQPRSAASLMEAWPGTPDPQWRPASSLLSFPSHLWMAGALCLGNVAPFPSSQPTQDRI